MRITIVVCLAATLDKQLELAPDKILQDAPALLTQQGELKEDYWAAGGFAPF